MARVLPSTGSPEARFAPIAVPDDAHATAALRVVMALRDAGFAAYLVGGCVRDIVLGVLPKDYDVATEARPEQVKAVLGKVIEVGARFGVLVAPVKIAGRRFEIEVATFRAESAYLDGRHPTQVRFTDAREDVLRRDFTINGLLAGPDGQGSWQVADFVGGLNDLRRGVIAAIGVPLERFEEDHLRVLRMVRFATRFGFAIDPSTMAGGRTCAAKLDRISHERVRDELVAMCQGPRPADAIELLAELGVGELLWRDFLGNAGLQTRAADIRLLQELLESSPPKQGPYAPTSKVDAVSAFAVLFGDPAADPHDRGRQVGHWFRLSKAMTRSLTHTWSHVASLPADANGPAFLRWLRDPAADVALVIAQVWTGRKTAALRAVRARATESELAPTPFVTGQHFREAGYRPSAAFRAALIAAEDVQLMGGTAPAAWEAAKSVLDANES